MSKTCRCYSREHSSCAICSSERNKMLSNEKRILEERKKEERMFNIIIMKKRKNLLSSNKSRSSSARIEKLREMENNIDVQDSHLFKVSPETKVSHLLSDIKKSKLFPSKHKLVLRVQKRRFGNEPLKSSYSKWQLDRYCDSCNKCHSKLLRANQKHHCRSCGLIFCNDCSSNKHVYLNGAYERTCNNCLKLLDNYPILCDSEDMKFYNIKNGDIIYVLSDIRVYMKKKKSKKRKSKKNKKKIKSKFKKSKR